jgi:hypothetical protein
LRSDESAQIKQSVKHPPADLHERGSAPLGSPRGERLWFDAERCRSLDVGRKFVGIYGADFHGSGLRVCRSQETIFDDAGSGWAPKNDIFAQNVTQKRFRNFWGAARIIETLG